MYAKFTYTTLLVQGARTAGAAGLMAAAAEPAAPAAAGAKRKRDDAAAEPPRGPFPAEWGEAEADGDAAWWGRLRLVDVALADPVALFIASHLRKCNGWLCSVRRVQSRQLWRKYTVRARVGGGWAPLAFPAVNRVLSKWR